MANRDLVLAWLNDAHAMERALEEVLERHLRDAEGHADIQSRLQSHLEETRGHAEQVKDCIDGMGGKVSQVKSALANMFGATEGMMNKPVQDTMVKNALGDYAAEHFEIASYRSLIAAAQEIGEQKVATVCEDICRQEEAMAQWLEQQLPTVTKEAVAQG